VHHCLPGADTVRLEVNTTADSRWVLSRGVLCEPFNYFHIVVLCLITLDSPVVGVYCVSLGVLAILYRSGILGGRAKLRKGTPMYNNIEYHWRPVPTFLTQRQCRFALVKLCRSPRQCRPWVCSVWGLPYTPRFLLWQFRPRVCWWHRAVATQVEIGAEIVKIICRPTFSMPRSRCALALQTFANTAALYVLPRGGIRRWCVHVPHPAPCSPPDIPATAVTCRFSADVTSFISVRAIFCTFQSG
jgi:hypothetical protein